MKFADRLKFTATTGTSAATITFGASIAGCRTLAQAISDGALIVGDTGVPFIVTDGAAWEGALFTITSTTQLTRTSVLASSAGGTNPATFTGTLTVFNDVPASHLNTLLSSAQGVAPSGLATAATLSGPNIFLVSQDGGATIVTTTLTAIAAAVAAINGTSTTPAETLTINTIAAQTAGTAFSVSGTYANVTPTALDWSVNGGSTWNAATSPTISGGNYSFGGVTVPTANASQTVMVRDHTNTGITATSAAFVVNATATETLTVNTPATQTVGTAFNVTGTYANGTPTALDYRLSDDTAGQWTQVTTATISGGTFSFSITPASASSGRTISVRDRNNTGVSATSGTYVVNAASTTSYTITPYTGTSLKTTIDASATSVDNGKKYIDRQAQSNGNPWWQFSTNPPAGAKSGWGTSATVAPAEITTAQNTIPNDANGMAPMNALTAPYYDQQAYLWVPVGSGTSTWYFWIKPSDGVAQCMTPSGVTVTGA